MQSLNTTLVRALLAAQERAIEGIGPDPCVSLPHQWHHSVLCADARAQRTECSVSPCHKVLLAYVPVHFTVALQPGRGALQCVLPARAHRTSRRVFPPPHTHTPLTHPYPLHRCQVAAWGAGAKPLRPRLACAPRREGHGAAVSGKRGASDPHPARAEVCACAAVPVSVL